MVVQVYNGVLGASKAHAYTNKFQKRRLPHTDILILLESEDKISTAERIDSSAEITDAIQNQRLREIVIGHMRCYFCKITSNTFVSMPHKVIFYVTLLSLIFSGL